MYLAGANRMKAKRIHINVSGAVYETTDICLGRYPQTLLGDPNKRGQFYIAKEDIYFFDRHRLAFEGILMFYQSYGRVIPPENVPEEVFHSELEFFQIDCEFSKDAREAKKYFIEKKLDPQYLGSKQERIWHILQNPRSCIGAQILSIVSLLMTLISIILACLNPGKNTDSTIRLHTGIFPFEMSCFVWFTLEYLLRLWSCPKKMQFLKSWIDSTDLMTLVVFYSSLALTSSQASSTSVLRVFRLANAFRVFRLTRFSNGLRLLMYTIYKSRTDLQLLAGFLAFFIVISGSSVYFAEVADNPLFKNGGIFSGIWFSIVSCTTVGYGDLVPVTLVGKFISSLSIIFGAMFILLPVLQLVNSFSQALKVTRDYLNKSDTEMEPIHINTKPR